MRSCRCKATLAVDKHLCIDSKKNNILDFKTFCKSLHIKPIIIGIKSSYSFTVYSSYSYGAHKVTNSSIQVNNLVDSHLLFYIFCKSFFLFRCAFSFFFFILFFISLIFFYYFLHRFIIQTTIDKAWKEAII